VTLDQAEAALAQSKPKASKRTGLKGALKKMAKSAG
jgi:hypothetical protein